MSAIGNQSRERHLPSAPRFSPMPQSPSPTMVSYLVTSGSTEMSRLSAVASVDLANLGSTVLCQSASNQDIWTLYL
jgi:hypothetical protein